MTSYREYLVRRTGGAIFADHVKEVNLRAAIKDGMDKLWERGPFRIKYGPKDAWGPPRTQPEVLDILVDRVPRAPAGMRILVDLVDTQDDRKRLTVRSRLITEGSIVLQTALNQLGDDYNFGDNGPERFDCSGLTQFSYAAVDYVLPHSAEMQRTDPRILNFTDRSKLKDGDLVFYDAGVRLDPGQADHVGIVDSPGMVVDASSSYDMVVHRPIDSNPIIGFGRVRAVNGDL